MYKMYTTRGHEFKIIPERSVIDIRKHFIAQRISQVRNELPPKIVNFVSLRAFKTSLHHCDLRRCTRY